MLWVDGGARGNPGPGGAGAVLRDGSGKKVAAMGWALGRRTNNDAEYEGLIRGLAMAASAGARRLEVRSDSELMVKQMNGEYRTKASHLREAAGRARAALAPFEAVNFTAIPRGQNGEADRLANIAMDEEEKRRPD